LADKVSQPYPTWQLTPRQTTVGAPDSVRKLLDVIRNRSILARPRRLRASLGPSRSTSARRGSSRTVSVWLHIGQRIYVGSHRGRYAVRNDSRASDRHRSLGPLSRVACGHGGSSGRGGALPTFDLARYPRDGCGTFKRVAHAREKVGRHPIPTRDLRHRFRPHVLVQCLWIHGHGARSSTRFRRSDGHPYSSALPARVKSPGASTLFGISSRGRLPTRFSRH
jgi:hypothetical protein